MRQRSTLAKKMKEKTYYHVLCKNLVENEDVHYQDMRNKNVGPFKKRQLIK